MGGYNDSPDTPLILSGTATVDLVPYRNATIVLAFGFEANDLVTGSMATISNLEINQTINTTPVPEPATMLLLGLGLAGLAGLKRKKHF